MAHGRNVLEKMALGLSGKVGLAFPLKQCQLFAERQNLIDKKKMDENFQVQTATNKQQKRINLRLTFQSISKSFSFRHKRMIMELMRALWSMFTVP